jgi:hypothetical protein
MTTCGYCVCVHSAHRKEIRQIKLGSSSKDLARISKAPVSNLSCDADYPYRDSAAFTKFLEDDNC